MKKKKNEDTWRLLTERKPPRLHISKAEFLRRLENIDEWRKKRLAKLRAELRAKGSR